MLGRDEAGGSDVVPLKLGTIHELPSAHSSRQPLVRIHVLGSLRATTYLGKSILPRGRKTRAMLGYLCLAAGEQVARSRLSTLLWGRVPERQSRGSFRQALRELTAAMGPLAKELIHVDLDSVRLDPRCCWIDAIAVLSSEPAPSQSFRSDLASLCTGELLDDLSGITPAFDQWLLAQRTRFTEQLRLLFDSELKQLGESDVLPERRAALARRVIGFDATHEGASRVLMHALLDMGERAQAMREYDRCRAALKMSLDVEPSSETRAVYQAIKTFSGLATREGNNTIPQEAAKPQTAPHASRLRVGVLQLKTGDGGAAETLAFSLGQEIAAGLARFRWFDVIALASPAASNGGGLSGKSLHYVVEGDLSGDDEKYRISVRLLDVTDDPRTLRRADFPVLREIPTRWSDDDTYQHVNNVVHYSMFDTAVNGWLIEASGVDIRELPAVGLVVETSCQYLAELRFPVVVTAGLAVAHVGTSSVVYQLALFGADDGPAAAGRFVHVYVDRASRRTTPIPTEIRAALAGLGPAP